MLSFTCLISNIILYVSFAVHRNQLPGIITFDKAEFALQLMEDYEISHLAVNKEDKFYGIISKHTLAEADGSATLATLTQHYITASVLPEDHLYHCSRQPAVSIFRSFRWLTSSMNYWVL